MTDKDTQRKIAESLDADAQEAREKGYESTAQVLEGKAKDYREATGQTQQGNS